MEILARKDQINAHKDAINRRLYDNQPFVETAIHRVSCLNRTVLIKLFKIMNYQLRFSQSERHF
jgi:hypothetical protein